MNIIDQLKQHVGEKVTVNNEEVNEPSGATPRVLINFAGTLEWSEDEQEFYVRVGEDYFAGAMGVSFRARHVLEVATRTCGEIHIALK